MSKYSKLMFRYNSLLYVEPSERPGTMLSSGNNKSDYYYLPWSGDLVVEQCERYKDTGSE